jgi:hypothetical protein
MMWVGSRKCDGHTGQSIGQPFLLKNGRSSVMIPTWGRSFMMGPVFWQIFVQKNGNPLKHSIDPGANDRSVAMDYWWQIMRHLSR